MKYLLLLLLCGCATTKEAQPVTFHPWDKYGTKSMIINYLNTHDKEDKDFWVIQTLGDYQEGCK
jgi:hypothetical protein